MKKPNPAKEAFLSKFVDLLIENCTEKFSDNMAFSLQFFDAAQEVGQMFTDWTKEQNEKLFEKLKGYSQNSIKYWLHQRVGSGKQSILEIYGEFPSKSNFKHPKHIPIDVRWARFRLESDMRLIGFFLPEESVVEFGLDKNIFYIVFLDGKHQFYLSETK